MQISDETAEKIKALSNRSRLGQEKWFQYWDLLFPGVKPPSDPCEFFFFFFAQKTVPLLYDRPWKKKKMLRRFCQGATA